VSVYEKMLALHDALTQAGIEHAFGGALALAWCTEQARGTIDVDINLFVPPEEQASVLAALPDVIEVTDTQRATIERDGQARFFWDDNPVDLFFNTTEFHEAVAERVRWEPLGGRELPFLSCEDLAVFKVFFNRGKDWVDLEAMQEAGTFDVEHVLGVVVLYLGADDPRVERVKRVASGHSAWD
jgi:hypothetical protein